MHSEAGAHRTSRPASRLLSVLACLSWLAAGSNGMLFAQSAPACSADSAYAWLDFWVGQWDVYVQDRKVGEDDVTKILSGCAVTESWTSASGQRGFSLFYFLPVERTWRQVWVTESALSRGGVKEKSLVERFADGGVRFQGTLRLLGGGTYLDRTTLTPLATSRVRQVIEISNDGGNSWQMMFDAVYVQRPTAAQR